MERDKRVLIFVNDINFFYTHRFRLINFLKSHGFKFSVACSVNDADKEILSFISNESVEVINLDFSRGTINPLKNLYLLKQYREILKDHDPDILYLISSKPNLLGGLANYFNKKVKVIYSITGLGYLFINNSIKSKVLRFGVCFIYKFLFKQKNASVILQNTDDLKLLNEFGVRFNRSTLIHGCGINIYEYQDIIRDTKESALRVCFAARLLEDKGINEFIEAADHFQFDSRLTFSVAGDIDEENPKSLTQNHLKKLQSRNNLKFFGKVNHNHMAKFFANHDVFVLPSYREGFSRSILEAAAAGLVVIASDVPGCRDLVKNNGFLVPVKSHVEIIDSINLLLEDRKYLKSMSKNSQSMVANFYSEEIIFPKFLDFFRIVSNSINTQD